MLKHVFALTALVVAASACTASAQSAETLAASTAAIETPVAVHEEMADLVSCDVRSRRTANGLLIQARAFADSDFDGAYDLRIIKSGASSSEINQSGDISMLAGETLTLGESEISIERGSRVRAVLTLTGADGEICERRVRL